MDISLSIDQSATDIFPSLSVQMLEVECDDLDYLTGILKKASQLVDEVVSDLERVERAVETARSWRPIYSDMGLKPSKFVSSAEALIKRARNGNNSWKIGHPWVDIYNAASIATGGTVGAYDLAKLTNEKIILRRIDRSHDQFTPLGGSVNLSSGNDDLIVYAASNCHIPVDYTVAS